MENYNKESENKLSEIIKQKEENDRMLLNLEWLICTFSLIFIIAPILVANYLPISNMHSGILMIICFIPAFIGLFFALKIEQKAGYYKCKECGHKYVPSFKSVFMSMHSGRTRYMRCPKCSEKSWQKKVLN